MEQSKNWLITRNLKEDTDISLQDYVNVWEKHMHYLVGQLEKGESGTRHFQFYVTFKTNQRLIALKKIDKHAHYDIVKKDNGAALYCMKEATRLEGPIVLGTPPKVPKV